MPHSNSLDTASGGAMPSVPRRPDHGQTALVSEADIARLDERVANLIRRVDVMSSKIDTLMTAHQTQVGKSLVIKGLTGTALAGLGAGALKIIELLTSNGQYGPPPGPWSP